jgi:hypothetical protein
MTTLPKYKQLISEFVRQQMMVLGPNLATSTANRISGLEVNGVGSVVVLEGEPKIVLADLVAEFQKLSPQLATYLTHLIFVRYPDIAAEFPNNLPKSNFVCSLIKDKA